MTKVKKKEKTGVDKILEDLEKKFGLKKAPQEDYTIVSTGSLQLNQAMGIGGTAVGKIIELLGPESSGKSTITLHQIAEYQKAFPSRKVALFDYEHAFDKKYASNLGVDVNSLLLYQPETMEQGYDMIISLTQNELVSCVVIDSQSAAQPKAMLEGAMGDATIGLQARINSKFCLKIKSLLDIHKVSLFFISQLRDNIGGMGDPTTTTGGKAIKFYADVRLKVWKLNDKANELNKTTIVVIKNKLAAPFSEAKINIVWGYGFDKFGELIDYAVEFDLLEKGGAGWFTLSNGKKLQGMEKMQDYFEENYEELEQLERDVLAKLYPEEIEESKKIEELFIKNEKDNSKTENLELIQIFDENAPNYLDVDTNEQLNIFEPKKENNETAN